MTRKYFPWIAGLGCGALALTVVAGLAGLLLLSPGMDDALTTGVPVTSAAAVAATPLPGATAASTPAPVQAIKENPTSEAMAQMAQMARAPVPPEGKLARLYQEVNPGVVQIRVSVQRAGLTGAGAGSGFIFDEEGHIVTNHHVVTNADLVTVIFHDGTEVRAQIVGTDAHSDLAVVKVDEVPEGAHPLPLGTSSAINPGDSVIAIGNPFSLGSSMTLGIVSAVGRSIPTAETPFSIPSAIQTDAAINPGNSGGPLLTSDGEVIGVNAQIESTTGTNTGVGFAIPSDVVNLVVPALIADGRYVWPWLGVTGTDVSLLVQEANDLETQNGAYILQVDRSGPAAQVDLRGASGETEVAGQAVPLGGDVVIEANGEPSASFTDLLNAVAFSRPGDSLELTILRNGEQLQVTVELDERPPTLGG